MSAQENGNSSSADSTHLVEDEESDLPERRTPLPVLALISVLLIQLAEPITATVIYPFINQFVRETGITKGDEAKTGYYAGIIESAFFFAESMTVVQWGYLSDHYGRRPILLCAPLGLTVAMLGFGTSTTFWPLVAFRCFQGIFNGNIGVSKSALAELTDATNRPDAFALIPFTWSLGVTTGPIIGGLLSNAATRWPDTLGRILYIKTHPYFLPCLVAGAFTMATFIFDLFALKETLPSIIAKEKSKNRGNVASDDFQSEGSRLISRDHGNQQSYGVLDSSSREIIEESGPSSSTVNSQTTDLASNLKEPQLTVIFTRPILFTLLNHVCLTFTDMCHFALLPLMYSTPIEYGGLGLDPLRIGTALGTFGLANSILQVNTLGPAVRKFGPRNVYRVAFSFHLGIFAMYPILHFLAQRAGYADGFVIAGIVFQLCFQSMIYMAYGSLQIILVECVPEGGPLGTVNGVAQMMGSGMRSIAPTFATSLFSISLQRNLANGNMVYYVLLAMTLITVQFTILLPKRPDPKRRRSSSAT